MLIALSPQPADEGGAPVVSTGVSIFGRPNAPAAGDASPQLSAFEELPRNERRHTDRQIARPLQEREGERRLRRQTKAGAEQNIGSFLDSDRIRNGKSDAACRIQQTLDHQYRSEIERGASKAQRDPGFQRTGDPADEMEHKAGSRSPPPAVDGGQRGMESRRAGSRLIGPAAAEHASKSAKEIKAAALDDDKPSREEHRRSQTERDGSSDCGVRLDIEET